MPSVRSHADPVFTNVDYSKGPLGEPVESRFTPETKDVYATTSHGYVGGNGDFVSHGSQIKWYKPPTSGTQGIKAAEGYCFGGQSHGPMSEWYENGRQRSKTFFVDGRQHGRATQWHDNGKKAAEMFFVQGHADGKAVKWFANGAVKSEITFDDGVPHGRYAVWDENGSLAVDLLYEHGVVQRCDRNVNTRRAFFDAFGVKDKFFLYNLSTTTDDMRRVLGEPDAIEPCFCGSYSHYWSYRFADGTLKMGVQELTAWALEAHRIILIGGDNFPGPPSLPTFPTEGHTRAEFIKALGTITTAGEPSKGGAIKCPLKKWFATFGVPQEVTVRGSEKSFRWNYDYRCQDATVTFDLQATADPNELLVFFKGK